LHVVVAREEPPEAAVTRVRSLRNAPMPAPPTRAAAPARKRRCRSRARAGWACPVPAPGLSTPTRPC